MTSFARPNADLVIGNWTVTPLFQKIDEVSQDDADFITDGGILSADIAEVSLNTVTDPQSSTGHIIRVRARKGSIGGVTLTVRLREGSTTRASFNATLTTSFSTSTYTLSGAEADSITNYGNLRLRFEYTGLDDPSLCDISWAEFEVPTANLDRRVTEAKSVSDTIIRNIPAETGNIARPNADISVASWTPTPSSPATLYDKIDEASVNDGDFITDADILTADTAEISLFAIVDPLSSLNHIIRVRGRKGSAGTVTVTVTLRQGATTIASFTPAFTTAFALYSYTLTGPEADGITDYTNLRLQFAYTGTQDGSFTQITWTEFSAVAPTTFARILSDIIDASDALSKTTGPFKRFATDSVDASDAILRALFRPPPSSLRLAISGSFGPSEPLTAVWLEPLDAAFGKAARSNLVKIPGRSGGVYQWGGAEPRSFVMPALFKGDYASMTVKREALENLVWHTTMAELRGRPATLSVIINSAIVEQMPVVVDSYEIRSRSGRKELLDVTLNLRHYED